MALSAQQFQESLRDLSNLPTLPGVVRFVVGLVEDENTDAQSVANVIARDQVLSAKVLRVVNSPFYGFPGRISSVSHAVVLLGFNVVKGLVISAAVFDNLGRDVRGLWEHSLGTALLSARIARRMRLPEPDEIMVAGLLHDLSKVIMAHLALADYQAAIKISRMKRFHIAESEKAVFGYDHCAVAGWLAERWHLPARLADALMYHHKPEAAVNSPECAMIVHVADIFARAMGYGDAGDPVMPPMSENALPMLGLRDDAFDEILKDAEDDFRKGMQIFGGGPGA